MKRIALVLLLMSSAAWGVDRSGSYVGTNISCGDFVAARQAQRNADWSYAWWVQGYLTAYNRLAADTYDIYGGTNLSSVMLWMENWCKVNPLKGLPEGMIELTTELHPRRYKTAGEAGK